MKKLLLASIFLGLVFVGPKATIQEAECTYCPTYTCYTRCSSKCACITPPGRFGGYCMGIDIAQPLLSAGYTVTE